MSPVAATKSAGISETGIETPTPRAADERGESDGEPFHRVEWAKQNCFHHFVRSAKGLKDFDLGFVAVHARISLLRAEQFKLALIASILAVVRLESGARPIQT
jgi:hypothetical protein